MTDNTDALDELVSRYLDAEATADEIARVESDPELLARAESMRAAIEAVAAPIEIPTLDLDLDRIRAAAIAESGTTAVVTDVMAARRRKLERRNRIMAVAAACVVLAVSVVAVQNLGGSDGDDSFDAATESSADASDEAGDDDMAEEDTAFDLQADGDDMAEEDTAMAEAEMAAEEDDMAEESDMAESDDMMEEAAGSTDAVDDGADAARADLDLLPDELPPVADAVELVDTIEQIYAEQIGVVSAVALSDEALYASLCPGASALLQGILGAGVASAEQASVQVGAFPVVAVVGTGVDGSLVVLTHAADDCSVVITQAIIEGP